MKKAITISACLLLLVPAVNAAWWSGKTADVNISYDSAPDNLSSRYPHITAGPEGNLYCIWRQGPSTGAGELYFGRSTDNGVTWSKPRMLLDSPNDDRHPSIRELSDGTLICSLYTCPGQLTGSRDMDPSRGLRVGFVLSSDGGKSWEGEA